MMPLRFISIWSGEYGMNYKRTSKGEVPGEKLRRALDRFLYD
jgi:hypothetical protein